MLHQFKFVKQVLPKGKLPWFSHQTVRSNCSERSSSNSPFIFIDIYLIKFNFAKVQLFWVCLLVSLSVVLRPTREYLTHMEMSPLPVKGFKF